jgi:hypothetical protein
MKSRVSRWLTEWRPSNRRARVKIDEQIAQLLSDAVRNSDELATLHLAKFALETDSEQRLRSLQTLVQMRRPEAVAFVIHDLVQVAHEWRRGKVGPRLELLTDLFLQILSWSAEDEYKYRYPDPHEASELPRRIDHLSVELHSYLIASSMGIDDARLKLPRYIPVRAYSADASLLVIRKLSSAVADFCESLGFSFADDFPAIHGSWFKKWFARAKEELSREEVLDRLKRAERAIELVTLHKPQASVDRDQAEGAARLIESLGTVANANCQVGSLLIVKTTDAAGRSVVKTRTLTADQMIMLERDLDVLKVPSRLIDEKSRTEHE